MIFHSGYTKLCSMSPRREDEIKNEPMLFGASNDFAARAGGRITREFLQSIYNVWGASEIVIDSRVHMLKKGWYPCIPGWHLDDFLRGPLTNQPMIFDPRVEKTEHILAVIDGGTGSLTEFLEASINIPDDIVDTAQKIHSTVYGVIHDLIEVERDWLPWASFSKVEPNTMVQFNGHTFHRGLPAARDGWRFFIRATRLSTRVPTNEVRKQTQVYIPNENEGW